MYKQPIGRLILLAAFIWGIPQAFAAPAPIQISTAGVTLADCYLKARQISENIGISAENVKAVQAQYRSEVGAVLPHIDWVKQQFYQERVSNGNANGAGSTSLATQPLSYFQVTQPLFAGMRDWNTVRILKSQEQQAKLAQRATDLQLLSDVASAFYLAITLQDQLAVQKETLRFNQDQVDQLKHWVDIGRSRPSELLSAQTQQASVQADIEVTRRRLAEARHLLLFLTGIPASVPLVEDNGRIPPRNIEEALATAGNRPDLQSAAESLHQADLAISFAKGAHLPVLGLSARSYTERVGFLSDVRWDATFLLDVPIYEGGSTQALVRQARAQEIIAQLALAHLKRDVERIVRTAYDDLSHAATEESAYEKAVQLALRNYDVQKKEYRQGMISNLELLQLLTNMQETRRQWLLSRANARLTAVQLRIVMGEGL